MKNFFKISFLAAITLVFLSACAGDNGSSSDGNNITNSGSITPMSDASHDWEDINIKGGDVSHTFAFRNDGSDDLYLKGAQTSCMCTTARYRLSDGSVSPKFGMHSSLGSWSKKVPAGESFDMEVVFDPMAHGPNATGPISRTVMLITSASNSPVMDLKLKGDVLSKEDYEEKYQN